MRDAHLCTSLWCIPACGSTYCHVEGTWSPSAARRSHWAGSGGPKLLIETLQSLRAGAVRVSVTSVHGSDECRMRRQGGLMGDWKSHRGRTPGRARWSCPQGRTCSLRPPGSPGLLGVGSRTSKEGQRGAEGALPCSRKCRNFPASPGPGEECPRTGRKSRLSHKGESHPKAPTWAFLLGTTVAAFITWRKQQQ